MTWIVEVLRRYHLETEFSRQRALLLWQEVAGPRISHFAQAVRVERGVLWVETSSATVAQELTLLKGQYLQALNERLQGDSLTDLRFLPGRVAVPTELLSRNEPSPAARLRARQAVEEVHDPALRAALERLYVHLDESESTEARP